MAITNMVSRWHRRCDGSRMQQGNRMEILRHMQSRQQPSPLRCQEVRKEQTKEKLMCCCSGKSPPFRGSECEGSEREREQERERERERETERDRQKEEKKEILAIELHEIWGELKGGSLCSERETHMRTSTSTTTGTKRKQPPPQPSCSLSPSSPKVCLAPYNAPRMVIYDVATGSALWPSPSYVHPHTNSNPTPTPQTERPLVWRLFSSLGKLGICVITVFFGSVSSKFFILPLFFAAIPLKALSPLPSGPFRTKNAMALKTVVFYYCSSVLLSVPMCCYFHQEKHHLQTLRRNETLWPQ